MITKKEFVRYTNLVRDNVDALIKLEDALGGICITDGLVNCLNMSADIMAYALGMRIESREVDRFAENFWAIANRSEDMDIDFATTAEELYDMYANKGE